MLIITSDIENLPDRAAALCAWPGPHLLVLEPGHGQSEDQLATLEERFVLYDIAAREQCQLNLLRKILLHADARDWSPSGPFLFMRGNPDDAMLADLAQEAAEAPDAMRFEGAADEAEIANGVPDLSLLIAGASAGESPLIMMFFRNMEPDLGPAHSRASLALLQEHLG